MYLRRERQILVLQIEALRRENQQAEADLEAQYNLHQQEMHSLREESLQVRLHGQTDKVHCLSSGASDQEAQQKYKSLNGKNVEIA